MKGIMIKRYLDLMLYSVISYLVLVFIGETELWSKWLQFWQNFHYDSDGALTLFFSSQMVFLAAGILITLFASQFQIYHPKRGLFPNFRFPPLTFAVGFVVLYWGFQNQSYLFIVLLNTWGLVIGLLILPLIHCTACKTYTPSRSSLDNLNITKSSDSDDLPKTNLSQLDLAPRYSAELLLNKLEEKQHIALCGVFGTGKTSVINAVVNQLEQDPKNSLIHCNIDLWGIATPSIVEFVLQQITLKVSEHLDVSGLRGLPSHYLDAIKSSNTSWSFLASLLNKHESPDNVLEQFNELLQVTRKKLIVTIQDIDRNENAKSRMDELAGLLERLKQSCSNITYIFASVNTSEFSETIRRVCPVRIDLAKPFLAEKLEKLFQELIYTMPSDYLSLLSVQELSFTKDEAAMIDNLLPNYRAFNDLEKMVKQAWFNNEGEGRLCGEVYPQELILMYALKNESAQIFDLVNQVGGKGNGDTLAALFEKHLPHASDADKDLTVAVCKFLGLLNENTIGLMRLSSTDDTVEATEIEYALSVKFNYPLNVLSVIKQDRKRIMLNGAIFDTEFSHLKAYLLFKNITEQKWSALDSLISEIGHGNRDVWLNALDSYGIRMFFKYAQDFSLPQRIIYAFSTASKATLSRSLLLCVDKNIGKSSDLVINNNFINYLVSDEFCNNLLSSIQYLKKFSLGDIIVMLYRISLIQGQQFYSLVESSKSVTRKIILRIANDSSMHSAVILISLFEEFNDVQRYEGFLKQVLNNEDVKLLIDFLDSIALDLPSLLKAFQNLYPEHNSITSDYLNRCYNSAKVELNRIQAT